MNYSSSNHAAVCDFHTIMTLSSKYFLEQFLKSLIGKTNLGGNLKRGGDLSNNVNITSIFNIKVCFLLENNRKEQVKSPNHRLRYNTKIFLHCSCVHRPSSYNSL